MNWILISAFFVLISVSTAAQTFYIKGRVTDGLNNQPLKGASVYINNSTKGTMADDTGEFSIGPLEPGKYEVVASYVGFAPVMYTAEIKTGSIKVIFELDRKEKPLREILILTSETRKRYLDLFKKNVLGYTSGAERCRIKNIDEVMFVSGDTKDEIQAYSDKELIIENPDLGYTIRFELIDFYYNRANTATYFYGYTRYEDWSEKEGKTKEKWQRKRRQVYEGSTVHFFRSLIKKEMKVQGFDALQLFKAPPPKVDTVNNGTVRLSTSTARMQMAQPITEDKMLGIYSDSGYKVYELYLREGWRIGYNKNTDLKSDLAAKNIFVPGQPTKGISAGLRKKEAAMNLPVLLSERGVVLTPMNIFFDGIWAYERLANMLPDDYEPEK